MFRTPLRPSSGAYNCTRSLSVLPLESGGWKVVGRGLAVYNLPDHDQQRSNSHSPKVKPLGSYCSCTLLMMGGEAPETCWVTHKRQVINLWNCCILLVDLFELPVAICVMAVLHAISGKIWLLYKTSSGCRNYLEPLLKSLTKRPSLIALADHQPNLRTFL